MKDISKKPGITVVADNQREGKPALSIVLVDWSCRESIHALSYLNDQSVSRDQYEIIWIEYYGRPCDCKERSDQFDCKERLRQFDCKERPINSTVRSGSVKPPVVDKWLTLNMPDDTIYNRHLMYNAGIVASKGEVIAFCDSDAIYGGNFVKGILEAFSKERVRSNIVLHLDEVCSDQDRSLQSLGQNRSLQLRGQDHYPSIDDIKQGSSNWEGSTTTGLNDKDDPLHTRHYDACMCASRQDLINIGGADQHMDYLGYVSGPYEMTFRLLNAGKKEVWLQDEFLYHAWHPGHQGDGDYAGPHDGKLISLRALQNLKTGRIEPVVENEAIRALRLDSTLTFEVLRGKLINPEDITHWSYVNVSSSEGFNMLYSEKPFGATDENGAHKSSLSSENVRVWKDPVEICLYEDFHIIKFYEMFYAMPTELGRVDFKEDEQNYFPGILKDKDIDKLKKLIDVKGKQVIEDVKRVNHPTLVRAYYGHNIVTYLNRFYAIPHGAGKVDFILGEHKHHPAVKTADTEEELKTMIDDSTLRVISTYNDHQIIKYGRCFYGLPKSIGYVDLFDASERNKIQVLKAKTQSGLELLIDDLGACFLEDDNSEAANHPAEGQDSADNARSQQQPDDDNTAQPKEHLHEELTDVEYGGWMPIFRRFGDCGNHPQFRHLESSPDGYKFVYSRPQTNDKQLGILDLLLIRLVKLWRMLMLIVPVLTLFFASLIRGARLRPIVEFISNRGIRSQLMMPRKSRLVFLPSVPFTYGQTPWVMEVEDTTSMFFPSLHNGRTKDLDITTSPYYPILKAVLELGSCRGIITHVRSTAESIPVIFKNPELARKITYIPLGVKIPQKFFIRKSYNCVNLLFTTSWHQNPESFFLRGGHDLLEAYSILQPHYPNLRMILRTSLLSNMDDRYIDIINGCNVRLIDTYLSNRDMQILQDQADIYVLPSARIHVVSILQAMANGLAVVVSDGWGIEEYVVNGYNGIVLKGRYGKVSWIDPQSGMLKEDYSHMFQPDPVIVNGLVGSLSALIENKQLRDRLGRNARQDVKDKYNVDNWNKGLKTAFDMALNKKDNAPAHN
ncbi:MAG: glycosyltransferase family 4 protein [Nitrospirae bacterium]|nr:glycosyltransferase family 4 protein [Nitrospirota bacterium]